MKKAIAIILSIMLVLAITLPATAVSSIAVKSIKLNSSKISLKVGQNSNLKVTFTPANTSQKKLTFVSDNKKIATVDASGKIIGVSAGTTTITVYTFNKKIFAKCNVTISKVAVPKVKDVTLKFMGDNPIDRMTKVIEIFNKKNPNIKIEYNMIPSDQYSSVLRTNIASNNCPDVFKWYAMPNMIADLNRSGVLYDMSNEPYIGKIKKSVLDFMRVDGKIYGVPMGSQSAGVIYNKDIFKELNLSIPQTFEDYLTICETIEKSGKYAPMAFGIKDQWVAQLPIFMLYQIVYNKYPNFDKDLAARKAIDFTKIPELKVAMEDYLKLKPYFNNDFVSTTYDMQVTLFAQKKAAMFPHADWAISMIISKNKDINFGVFPMPAPKGMESFIPVTIMEAFQINKNTKYLEAANKFMETFTDKDALNSYLQGISGSVVEGQELSIPKPQTEFYNNYVSKSKLQGFGLSVPQAVATQINVGVANILVGNDIDSEIQAIQKSWVKAVESEKNAENK